MNNTPPFGSTPPLGTEAPSLPLTEDVPLDLVVTRDDALRIIDDLKRANAREAQRELISNPPTGSGGHDLRMLKYDERDTTLRALQLVLRQMSRRTVLVQGPEVAK